MEMFLSRLTSFSAPPRLVDSHGEVEVADATNAVLGDILATHVTHLVLPQASQIKEEYVNSLPSKAADFLSETSIKVGGTLTTTISSEVA